MKLILLILMFLGSSAACGDGQKMLAPMQNNTSTMQHVNTFIANFATFSMDIQAAGVASIPKATISDKGELFIAYAYTAGSEKRTGKMTLHDRGNNRFEGHWKTAADNGNSYQGSLYFIFDALGNANGSYEFGGSNYNISIVKTKK